MHIGQLLPLVGRTPPRQRMGKIVTAGAGVVHVIVRNVGLVVNAPLRILHDRLGFHRRQSMGRAEVLHDGARLRRSERHAIRQNHSLQRFLPAFGRSTLPGNALHVALLVDGVAGSTFCDDQRIGDGNACLAGAWLGKSGGARHQATK